MKELLAAPYTYANADLAAHYGLQGPTGAAFEKVAAPERSGILSQAMLAVQDGPTRTSIVSLRSSLSLTSVVVTHDLPSAYRVSDRLALVAHHRIALIDDVTRFRQSAIPEVQSYLHAMDADVAPGVT